MTGTTSFITTAAIAVILLSLASFGDAQDVSTGSKGRTNALSLNGLQLNGARLEAVDQVNARALIADRGRFRLAAR